MARPKTQQECQESKTPSSSDLPRVLFFFLNRDAIFLHWLSCMSTWFIYCPVALKKPSLKEKPEALSLCLRLATSASFPLQPQLPLLFMP